MKVREISSKDSDQLFRISAAARLKAYEDLIPPASQDFFESSNDINKKNLLAWRNRLEDFLADARYTLKAAENDNVVIGWYIAFNKGGSKHLHSLFVDPAYQGVGAGSVLINDFFSDEKCEFFTVSVLEENIPAVNFYRKHGFRVKNRLKSTYLGANRILMEKQKAIA